MVDPPQTPLPEELEAAEKLIMRWDTASSDDAKERMIFDGGQPDEAARYLSAVNTTLRSPDHERAKPIIQAAMARLEDEFRHILVLHSEPLDPDSLSESFSLSCSISRRENRSTSFSSNLDDPTQEEEEEQQEQEQEDQDFGNERETYVKERGTVTTDTIHELDQIPDEAIIELKKIAELMVSAGYSRECIQVFGSVRKPIVDAGYEQFGIERMSIGDVQRLEWQVVEGLIKRWVRAARASIRLLFASERLLCESVFEGAKGIGDACFMEVVKGATLQLFNFAEAISIGRRSPEKLFKILDLHDALSELVPDISLVFQGGGPSDSVRVQASEILTRLGEAARGTLSEFENAIQRENSRAPMPGGTIHPLTRYVMNYTNLISLYQETLSKLIVTNPSPRNVPGGEPLPELDLPSPESDVPMPPPLTVHLKWITTILQHNLEGKAQLYRDPSQSHLFLMNNARYVVQKVNGSPELRQLLGDDWLRKHTGRVRVRATSYLRTTWAPVLLCLRDEGIHVSGGLLSGVSKAALKERFKSFNSAFDEVHRTQATWIVPDVQLREELRISIQELLLPAYRSFLGRFRNHLESGRHSELYIKYSVEDLEAALLNFFEGGQAPWHSRRKSH
ncbi:hypothetical protein AMTRI_Chr12g233960 [Amborella trichopoda]